MNELCRNLLSGYVLAGGASSRMGQDKAFLPFEGQTMIEHAVTKLRAVCGDVAVLSGFDTPQERRLALGRYGRLVPDGQAHSGPVAGICSALADATTPWVMVIAVDQPYLPASLLRCWFEHVNASGSAASCMQLGDRLQPVPLLLRQHLAGAFARCLQRRERKVLTVVETALAETSSPNLHRFAVPADATRLGWFRNLNRPEDLLPHDVTATSSNQNTVYASE